MNCPFGLDIDTDRLLNGDQAVAVQLSRFWYQVDTSNARFWTTLAYLGTLFCLGLYVARGDWRETLG